MVTSVYLRKLTPDLYAGDGRVDIKPDDNFNAQVRRRLTRIVYMVNTRTRPVYWDTGRLVQQDGGVHIVAGLTKTRGPYLLSVVNAPTNEIGGVEIGTFSDDSLFVEEVRESMESGLPGWIRAGDTDKLTLRTVGDFYAIVSKRKKTGLNF